jgi:hypothetical protein
LGIVLDSTVLIRGERETATVAQVLQRVQSIFGDAEMSLSAMSAG